MSYLSQKTIKKTISFSGVGLHTGAIINVSIKSASPDTGIVFKRVDLKKNNLVYPNFLNVKYLNEFSVYPFCSKNFVKHIMKHLPAKMSPMSVLPELLYEFVWMKFDKNFAVFLEENLDSFG